MIHNDQVLGKPLQQYNDLKAIIEALTGVPEGSLAWASDTNELLKYNGTTWTVVGTEITPGGSDGQIQYNDGGTALGGIPLSYIDTVPKTTHLKSPDGGFGETGQDIKIEAGSTDALTGLAAGSISIVAADAHVNGAGGNVTLSAGANAAAGPAGDIILQGKSGATKGGAIQLKPGENTGGVDGRVEIHNPVSAYKVSLNTDVLVNLDRVQDFIDDDGAIALTATSVTDSNFVAYDGTAGKLKDSTVNSSSFATAAQGVTNGDSHDHSGGDGAQINHTTLSNIGTNTHAQIDTHISNATHYNLISPFLELPGLRAFWPMSSVNEDGNPLDLSGQGRTLTNSGSTAFSVYNNFASYADLNGSTNYLGRSDEPGLSITGAFMFLCWVYLDSVTGVRMIASKGNGSTAAGSTWALYTNSGVLTCDIYNSSSTKTATGATLSTSTWYLVGIRYAPSSRLSVLLNGAESGFNTTSIFASINNDTSAINLGAASGGSKVDGRIGPAALCAAANSDTIFANVYNRTANAFGL